MKEPKFDENVENIYNTLSDEQKSEYKAKEDSMNKTFIIVGIILTIICVGVAIGLSVWLVVSGEASLLPVILVIFVAFIVTGIIVILSSKKSLNSPDKIKIKTRIKRLEAQKQLKQQEAERRRIATDVNYRLQTDKIKSVRILDSYTEVSDKLHAILNYQEIIQTRVYKFNVVYNDGTSKVVTTPENSEEYAVLMPLVGQSVGGQTTVNYDNNIEKLREYKKLLDDGIITQEEFEQKKKELL